METLSFWKKSFYSAMVFFGTLIILSVGYGALTGGLSTADKVGSGSGLTSASWNRIVDGVLELDTRLSNFSFVGGNVGIGVPNPWQKLSVAGTIESTSGGFKFPDGTTQTSKAGTMANITVNPTNGAGSSVWFAFNLTNGTYPFGTASSATNLFTFNKAGNYIAYAWGESWFLAWQPVLNGTAIHTHNYAAAEDMQAVYFLSATNSTTFTWNFLTNHSNPLTGYVFTIVRLGD